MGGLEVGEDDEVVAGPDAFDPPLQAVADNMVKDNAASATASRAGNERLYEDGQPGAGAAWSISADSWMTPGCRAVTEVH